MSDIIAPVKMMRWDTGTLTWVVWDGSLTTGALVIGAVTQSGTWTVQPGNTANTTAWKVDGSAVTQPVSGTFLNQRTITPNTEYGIQLAGAAGVAGETRLVSVTNTDPNTTDNALITRNISGMATQGGGAPTLFHALSAFGITTGVNDRLESQTANPAGTERGLVTRNIPSGTQPISAASLPLPTGAAIETTQAAQLSRADTFKTRSDTFTTTANGTTVDVSTSPLSAFAVSVKQTGTVTSWDVRLEGSLNNSEFTSILTHTNVTGDGVVLWTGTLEAPTLYFRSRCAGIVLGAGTNVVVTILGQN